MPNKMKHLIDRLRDEKPLCRVCGQPVDPDDERRPPEFITVPLDPQGDGQGIIPVHSGACRVEAEDRLQQAQAIVNLRRIRQGEEAAADKAKRLIDSGEATDLG